MASVGDVVLSRKIKLDGTEHVHEAEVVGVDRQGLWLFSPAGTIVRDGANRPREDRIQVADGVLFYPTTPLPKSGGWFCAWHWAPAPRPAGPHWARRWISIDIAARTGPTTFVDHEIDLWCSAEDSGVVDEDELDEVERNGQLNSDAAQVARDAAAELHAALRNGYHGAFDDVGWDLLTARVGS